MFKLIMPPIKRKFNDKYLFIPGGWHADVPENIIESGAIEAWALYFRQEGMGTIKSIVEAKELQWKLMAAAWRPGLMSHTAYWAKKYALAYPDTMYNFAETYQQYELDGFDPERVQTSYVPFHRHGRKGQPFMNNLLREMYDET